jgi:hypothetical protein
MAREAADFHSGPARSVDVAPPEVPDPLLTRARIWFHTNDEDKNDDSRVTVTIFQRDRNSPIAVLSGNFGTLRDHSDFGPVALMMLRTIGWLSLTSIGEPPVQVEIALDHLGTSFLIGEDTWHFGFLLDLEFADGGHLFAMDNDVALDYARENKLRFPIS